MDTLKVHIIRSRQRQSYYRVDSKEYPKLIDATVQGQYGDFEKKEFRDTKGELFGVKYFVETARKRFLESSGYE